jgi:hypothetical protein
MKCEKNNIIIQYFALGSYRALLVFGIALTFFSCEEFFFEEVAPNTPVSIFDQTWKFANEEYVFFDFKNINWDSVYQVFRPMVTDNMTDEALFNVLADMLFLLRDGHVNLRSKFDRSRNWDWRLGYPENFDFDLLERNYWKTEQQFVGSLIVHDFGDVGYMRYSSFSNSLSNDDLDYVINKFKNHKGLIIDVRSNGGGLLSNASKIAKRFSKNKKQVARIYYKDGPAHDDLDGPYSIDIEPPGDLPLYANPVVVLTNRGCYSATSFFVQYMRELDDVTILGDWTGGGGGAPSFTELTNGWELRVSSTVTTSPEDFNIEDGVPPDVKVDMTKEDETKGDDTILEAALELLRK